MASGSARQHWATWFGAVEQQQCDDIVADIPDLSPMTGSFVSRFGHH
jgi:PhoPQ-activated pathogenicity-related protein